MPTVEELDEISTRLEHALWKFLRCITQETRVSKSSARTATKLMKLK
jgi:hypothetical protein